MTIWSSCVKQLPMDARVMDLLQYLNLGILNSFQLSFNCRKHPFQDIVSVVWCCHHSKIGSTRLERMWLIKKLEFGHYLISYFIYNHNIIHTSTPRVIVKLVCFCQIYYIKLYTIEITRGFNHCNTNWIDPLLKLSFPKFVFLL